MVSLSGFSTADRNSLFHRLNVPKIYVRYYLSQESNKVNCEIFHTSTEVHPNWHLVCLIVDNLKE